MYQHKHRLVTSPFFLSLSIWHHIAVGSQAAHHTKKSSSHHCVYIHICADSYYEAQELVSPYSPPCFFRSSSQHRLSISGFSGNTNTKHSDTKLYCSGTGCQTLHKADFYLNFLNHICFQLLSYQLASS